MMKIGLFTDAHYAAGQTLLNTRTCGRSCDKIRRIFAALSPRVDAFVQLGDLVNVTHDAEADRANIRCVQKLLAECGKPVYGVLGNHDVETARKRVFLPGQENGYYAFELDGYRMIALDGNFTAAGDSYEDVPWNWKDSAIPPRQLEWLGRELEAASGPVVILCHQNLDERQGDPHVIANAGEVRGLLEASGKVAAVLQGHKHSGAFSRQNGIPYHTFRALCERDDIPCALVTLTDDGQVLVEEMELNEE